MANHPTDGPDSDFLAQILGIQAFTAADPNLGGEAAGAPPMLQLSSGDPSAYLSGGVFQRPAFPSGLSLDQRSAGLLKDVFPGQTEPYMVPAAPRPPAVRPRVRARRGQATDPHSIAERMRRERIAERIRALQGLVPSVNKTDKVAMLDEVVDYVNFLRLQVKVLSMSRSGGSDAVAPLVTDIPTSSAKDDGEEGARGQPAWEGCSNEGTEQQVAELMEENVGAAMQFLQSKQLCIMPVSLASAMYRTAPSNPSL